jgi:nucleotide-binding universal stress UspA family protein
MRVVAWITEGTWPACVDAVRDASPVDTDTILLHVVDEEVSSVAHGAFAGLLGRSHPERDPGLLVEEQSEAAALALLHQAAERLGRPSRSELRRGRVEREVVAASQDADLLVVARDGDRTRLGPKSLGHECRFVVDHAPCAVLLVWPGPAPRVETVPPPPGHPY